MKYNISKSICVIAVLATIMACSTDEYENHDESNTNLYTKEKVQTTEKALQANKALITKRLVLREINGANDISG